jgi:nucleoside-diphosphate-sugar epimerase
MSRALILGGTGAIGRATARRLLAEGWRVELTGRDPARMPAELASAGARFVPAERGDVDRLTALVGDGVDLLVDCLCYTAADAAQLLDLGIHAGSTAMISSKAVYVDADGNHSNSKAPPVFDRAIDEEQPTLAPGGGDHTTREGYGANKVAAERLLLDSGLPVTVLRPSKIHGAGARRPREWVFVKRVLDRRPAVFLAGRGSGVDHPSAAANVASLIEVVARRPAARILNLADPDAPSGLEISHTIASHLGRVWEEILLDDDADPSLGRHPWDARPPIVLDTAAAIELGYRPVGSYAATVIDEVDWLVAAARGRAGADRLPEDDDPFFAPFLDYAAEDRFLAARTE